MSRRLLLVAALVVVPSIALAGPSKAWTAAKKVHPDAPIIVGLDVASAKSSDAFKKFYPMLLKKEPDAQKALDLMNKECGLDPFAAINSVVAVIDDKGGDNDGAFYIALDGWDAAKLGDCGKKIAATEKKELKPGPVKKGIQEIEMVGESKKIYLGWIGKDVLVFATKPDDKKFVEKMLRGKGGGKAGKLAAKLDTSSTVWMAVIKEQDIPDTKMKMKTLSGTVKIASGNVATDVRMGMGNKTQAADFVTLANAELPKLQGQLPAAAQAILKTLKLKAAGTEVQATANATEKDLLDLLNMVMAFL
jgi:hypothetical protein